jgi:hypothetical protein
MAFGGADLPSPGRHSPPKLESERSFEKTRRAPIDDEFESPPPPEIDLADPYLRGKDCRRPNLRPSRLSSVVNGGLNVLGSRLEANPRHV